MPIYEYQCIPNKHRFEVMQKFSDNSVTKCAICGEPVERLVSAPAIQFKGSGWYITDYARKSDGKDSSNKESDTSAKPAEKTADTTSSSSDKKETSTTGGSDDSQ